MSKLSNFIKPHHSTQSNSNSNRNSLHVSPEENATILCCGMCHLPGLTSRYTLKGIAGLIQMQSHQTYYLKFRSQLRYTFGRNLLPARNHRMN